MRKYIHLLVGFGIALVCIYYAFRGVSLHEIGSAFQEANLIPILAALGIYVIAYLLRAMRWSVLIKPVSAIRTFELFWVMIIGYFANNILPFRMGEVVRAHLCGSKFKISRTASLGSILLERICDTLAFLSTFLAASLFYQFPRYMEKGAWLLGSACLIAIGILLLIRFHESRFYAILNQSPVPMSWKHRLNTLIAHFIQSTSHITRPRYVVEAMVLSLMVWVIEGTFLYLMILAFALPLHFGQAFFLLFALGLSVTLPQAPGYLGTYEFFGVTALSLLGIMKSQALSLVLAIHGTQFIFVAVLGLFGLWREGLTFHSLSATARE